MNERHGDRPDTPITEPAPTLTSKVRSDVWLVDRRTNSKAAGGGTVPTVPVPMSEPAPTFTGKSGHQWVLRSGQTVNGGDLAERPVEEPALTVTGRSDLWCWDRPATTIVASFRPDIVAAPGYRVSTPRQDAEGSVKITVEEALILQSFDPAYPVQGSKSKKFEQVGNAVPPLLAAHVIASLTGRTMEQAA